ncbi:MAG: septum formation initiator family protein [Deltaproteobacteria bacterium]|nr:septum formation initiator family protein [Deltaproteobacteria bacterium]
MAASSSSSRWVRFWALFNGALVALLIGGALFGDGGIVRHERLDEELRHVKELNSDLSRENVRLREEARALRHDRAAVERVVRDELGWVRPDEVVLILDGDEP